MNDADDDFSNLTKKGRKKEEGHIGVFGSAGVSRDKNQVSFVYADQFEKFPTRRELAFLRGLSDSAY